MLDIHQIYIFVSYNGRVSDPSYSDSFVLSVSQAADRLRAVICVLDV